MASRRGRHHVHGQHVLILASAEGLRKLLITTNQTARGISLGRVTVGTGLSQVGVVSLTLRVELSLSFVWAP